MVLGPDHPDTLTCVNNLAFLLQSKGDHSAAEPLFRQALAGTEKALGPDHPDTQRCVTNLAVLYCDMGRHADAVPLLERAAQRAASRPEMAWAVPAIRSILGLSLLAIGRPDRAEPHLLVGYDGLTKVKTLSPQNRTRLRLVTQALVDLCDTTHRPAKAAEWRAKLAALPPEVAPPPRAAK